MHDNDSTNKRLPSTQWTWKMVRVPATPPGPGNTSPKASSSPALSQWDRRTPLTVIVTYRGGPECWFEFRARGKVWRRPGVLCVLDLMNEIYAGTAGKPPSSS